MSDSIIVLPFLLLAYVIIGIVRFVSGIVFLFKCFTEKDSNKWGELNEK